MRLTDFEKNFIVETFKMFSSHNTKIYLFGSRADDSKKGGDIDLLIVFVNSELKSSFKNLDFIIQLKKKIGERKVDTTLATADELKNDIFLLSIIDSAVELVA